MRKRLRPFPQLPLWGGKKKAMMQNIVNIETPQSPDTFVVQPPEAPQAQPKAEPVPKQAPHDLLVTEKAVKRIRAVMAKEGISPEEGGMRLGVSRFSTCTA